MITTHFLVSSIAKPSSRPRAYSPERGMPSADDYLLIRIKINRFIGPASNITVHRDLFPSHGKVGNWSGCANIDPYLTYINQTGKLSSPSPVFCIKIRGVTIGTSLITSTPSARSLTFLRQRTGPKTPSGKYPFPVQPPKPLDR